MLYIQNAVRVMAFALLSTPVVALVMELVAIQTANSYQQVTFATDAVVYQAITVLPTYLFLVPLLVYMSRIDSFLERLYPKDYHKVMVEGQLTDYLLEGFY